MNSFGGGPMRIPGAAFGTFGAPVRAPSPLVQGRYKATALNNDPATQFLFLPSREHIVGSILQGRYLPTLAAIVDGKASIRRVLDFGAGEGAFSVWAWQAFDKPWIDAIEYDEELARLLVRNAPPGARLLEGGELNLESYDLIRIAHWEPALAAAIEVAPWVLVEVAVPALTPEKRAERANEERETAKRDWARTVKETTGEVAPCDDEHPDTRCELSLGHAGWHEGKAADGSLRSWGVSHGREKRS